MSSTQYASSWNLVRDGKNGVREELGQRDAPSSKYICICLTSPLFCLQDGSCCNLCGHNRLSRHDLCMFNVQPNSTPCHNKQTMQTMQAKQTNSLTEMSTIKGFDRLVSLWRWILAKQVLRFRTMEVKRCAPLKKGWQTYGPKKQADIRDHREGYTSNNRLPYKAFVKQPQHSLETLV